MDRTHGGPDAAERARVGLCTDCRHARRLVSAKQSVFYRCARAAEDEAYRDYPPLPVLACPGFEPDATGARPADS